MLKKFLYAAVAVAMSVGLAGCETTKEKVDRGNQLIKEKNELRSELRSNYGVVVEGAKADDDLVNAYGKYFEKNLSRSERAEIKAKLTRYITITNEVVHIINSKGITYEGDVSRLKNGIDNSHKLLAKLRRIERRAA